MNLCANCGGQLEIDNTGLCVVCEEAVRQADTAWSEKEQDENI